MKPIPSTAEILVFKILNRNVTKKWIDWAYDMLEAGFKTENLIILAGKLEPYNQFEVQRLAEKVFNELNLGWDDREAVYKNYVSYLVNETFTGKFKVIDTLSTLKDICIEDGYEPYIFEFYSLYYAYDDLIYMENQWYWPGATRENIDEIILTRFMKWSRMGA